ncbi:MAG: family deacetylase [Myxococcaceae bacterium]|nr:family deacetylase [Myxococcaceae bacterium]
MDTEALNAAPYPWYRLREESYDALYISPHMDDAVYSCGGQIALDRAAGKRILIITVFGDGADSSASPSRTKPLGIFSDYAQRKREERAAVEQLDVDHLWLNYPDLLVRPKRLAELVRYGLPFVALGPSELQARLYAALHTLGQRLLAPRGGMFFPLAIGGHPDHRIVHAVGRTLSADRNTVWFYEDIPYAQVPALRDERLRHLGLSRPSAAWAAARQAHDFAFAHAPRWQRPFTLALVAAHALGSRALFRAFGDKAPTLQEHDLHERDIDSVIDIKVAAMRAYRTQTAFFFPPGDAIYQVLTRARDRYVERYWGIAHVGARIPTDPAHMERESARVDALLRERVR